MRVRADGLQWIYEHLRYLSLPRPLDTDSPLLGYCTRPTCTPCHPGIIRTQQRLTIQTTTSRPCAARIPALDKLQPRHVSEHEGGRVAVLVRGARERRDGGLLCD